MTDEDQLADIKRMMDEIALRIGAHHPTMGKYILRGHEPVLCNDLILWATWFEDASRIVQQDQIGDYLVSTVFLGIDHNFGLTGTHRPILFESMTFVREEADKRGVSGGCNRYCTWGEALAGHLEICERLRNAG